MIDLLKNYKQLKNGSGYVSSLRYYLAKKKLDVSKKKSRHSLSNGSHRIRRLQPNPLFSHHKVPMVNPNLNQSGILSSTIPRGPGDDKETPQRKSMNETYTPSSMIKSTILPKSLQSEVTLGLANEIPQFYFPKGKPTDVASDRATLVSINAAIGQKTFDIDGQKSKKLLQLVVGIPSYFSQLLIIRGTNNPKAQKISRADFMKMWKLLESQSPMYRAFWLLSSSPNKKYLTIDDFKLLFKQILQVHPGLQFLKETPQFQEWYSLCVIHRMYYMANRKYDLKMTYRQFKNSNIFKSLVDIQAQPDINRNPDFFSYEDFYVIYIKFWELDNDHDFQLSREELSKYSGYTLSRKTLERIFSQTVRKFQYQQKMGFGDFVWFILTVQDKTTVQSIEYWFKIMDLDGNGIITGYQLEYFYEEQSQRLAYMQSNLDFNFQNILCQMVDIFKKDGTIHFTLEDFLKRKSDCSVFINMLTDLNKLINFEQRDAYEERNVKVENPDWSQWDRFVKPEYRRIESAQENQEGEVLNWQQDD